MKVFIICLACVVIGGACAVIGFMRGINKALEEDKKDPWRLDK